MQKGIVHVNQGLATRWDTRSTSPFVPLHGIPGFHHVAEASGVRMASMKADKDLSKYRIFTQGDGPSNKGNSRFGTACESE
ncbi:MAG TPA: hypothetical protein PKD45_06980 [Flavobacteriales bacterium]|nr:hypothetical protein [Flavobacteriales bacterium]